MDKPRQSLGFPHLERLVEQDDFKELNQTFLTSYDELEKIAQRKGGDPVRKKQAKKAMRAMELTMNLLRDFLQIKEDLLKKAAKP